MLPEASNQGPKRSFKEDGEDWVVFNAKSIDSNTGEEIKSESVEILGQVECFMPQAQLGKCIGIIFAYIELSTPLHGYYNVALPLDNQSTDTRDQVLYRLTRKRKKFSLDLDKETYELLQNYRSKRRMEIIEKLEKIYLDENGEQPADDSSANR